MGRRSQQKSQMAISEIEDEFTQLFNDNDGPNDGITTGDDIHLIGSVAIDEKQENFSIALNVIYDFGVVIHNIDEDTGEVLLTFKV